MTEKEMIQCALNEGFAAAAVVDTEQLVFEPAFRRYCEENLCGQYGANYSCPPSCGSPGEMRKKVLVHKKALVLQSVWEIADYSDAAAVGHAQDEHNAAEFRVAEELRAQGHDGLLMGASGCRLCAPCAQSQGLPCKHPELRYSCMSAYCVFVEALAETCGMTYNSGRGRLGFFGLYAFD